MNGLEEDLKKINLMEIQGQLLKIITRDCNIHLSEFDKSSRKINNYIEALNNIINKNSLRSIENSAFYKQRIQLFFCSHITKPDHMLSHKENLPKVKIL